MALCETVWVLRAVYGLDKAGIILAVEALNTDRTFAVEEPGALKAAMGRYKKERGDLTDYFIDLYARKRDAVPIYTFDKALQGEPGFVGG